MDSYSARGNSIFCTFVTVLGTTAVLNHLSTFLPMKQFDVRTSGTVHLNKIHDLIPNSHHACDQSVLSFNVSHQLSSEFHWNMNQLFVYLVATYNDTASNMRNEALLKCFVLFAQTEQSVGYTLGWELSRKAFLDR
ncbi:Arxes2 [Symbiodinium pilosum]|uniref:Signal peptidase complex subunit 3 n=1 Tax=Symbiodinium pilosum TaxID=2952 RepID=A0A812X3U6_SYMPI|nr:Arxes2 [Symbiodinium pilosum]